MRIALRSALCLCLVAALSMVTAAQKTAAPRSFYTAGLYDNIRMTSKESGDYFGLSIYLAQSANDTFAMITRAEGGFFSPVLVKAKMSGKDMRTIEFTLPDDNGDKKYKGTVTAAGITLVQDVTKSTLKRTCGKTYTNMSTGEGGDVGGTELYIMDSGGSWFVLASFAEGELSDPVLIPAEVTGKAYDKVAFSIGDRKFTGTIGKTTLTLNEGGSKSVLKSKCYK